MQTTQQPLTTITIPYTPNAKQALFHASPADEIIYGGSKGGGKAVSILTPLPTPTGWTTMGEVRPGDELFGADGEPVTVLAATGVMFNRPCYRLTFDDGTEVIADAEHLWQTYTAADLRARVKRTDEYREHRRATRPSRGSGKRPDLAARNRAHRTRTKEPPIGGIRTTQEISDTLTVRDGLKNHTVMLAGPLMLPDKALLISPYVLGAWLGDGTAVTGVVTTVDAELPQLIEREGYPCIKTASNKYGYRVVGLTVALRQAGVLTHKHIPGDYLRASKEQRMALLQGLMDTDGYARKHGGVEFTSTDRRLAADVCELILSLGFKATVREGVATLNGKEVGPMFRIVFTPDVRVFRLSRKAETQRLARSKVRRAGHRFIVACEPIPSVPVKCIKVSGSGMFLCSASMIPTHNSCALVMEALAYALENVGATVYLFRETYDDLEANLIKEWKERVPKELYTYTETKRIASLPNGSKVYFRYLESVADAEGYDGRSIDFIGVDELTKHEEEAIQILLSCLRSAKGFKPKFVGTCNPGNIGHRWVKARYIVPTHYGKHIITDEATGSVIQFIPARVYDNFAIMDNDPAYVRRLENLPPKKKQAYLDGDWDIYEGQAFEDFNPLIHVCEPFAIPAHWRRWRSCDNGFTDPFAWYWFAVDEDGIVYIYREFTRSKKDDKITYSEQARKVMELSRYRQLEYSADRQLPGLIEHEEQIGFTVVGHDAWSSHPLAATKSGASKGKTIIDYYAEGGLKDCIPCITDRRLRKATWHEYLQVYAGVDGKPTAKLKIFSTCEMLIETLPMQPEDEQDSEKVGETSIDHWYDSAGYGLIAWHSKQSEPYREALTGDAKRINDHINSLARGRNKQAKRHTLGR